MLWWGRDKKAELQDRKRVVIKGQRFLIRRLNPLIDFTPEKMPQIFTAWQSRRKADASPIPTDERKALADMMAMVEVGVVGVEAGGQLLPLVPVGRGDKRGREDGLTVEDLFRDQEVGAQLYWEILLHTLNRFRGLKKVFFYLKTRFWRFMLLRGSMARLPITSPGQMVA